MAATLQRKSSDGIIFVIITKIITKEIVPRNYFVIISARIVVLRLFRPEWYAQEFKDLLHIEGYASECTTVAVTRLRMRILTRPKNSLANFLHQIQNKKLRIRRREGIR